MQRLNLKKSQHNLQKIAEKALGRDANSTTCVGIYPPKVSANLEYFKKISK